MDLMDILRRLKGRTTSGTGVFAGVANGQAQGRSGWKQHTWFKTKTQAREMARRSRQIRHGQIRVGLSHPIRTR